MKNSWLFPVIESLHLIGLAIFVGTLSLRSFHTLGWVQDVDLRRWTRAGLILILATGHLMFFSDTARYFHNPAFLAKMGILMVAWITQSRLAPSRMSAWLSLILWSGVVLGGRAIADFD